MLIHEAPPPSGDDRPPLRPNWRLCFWLATAAVVWFAAAHSTGFTGFVLICATFGAICRAATEAIDYAGGLSEWRQ